MSSSVKIFSPNVIDITLVDLPGIPKVPVGYQSSDIEARIKKMIMSYIKTPTCLILTVVRGDSDWANSEPNALQMARIADPDGDFLLPSMSQTLIFSHLSNGLLNVRTSVAGIDLSV